MSKRSSSEYPRWFTFVDLAGDGRSPLRSGALPPPPSCTGGVGGERAESSGPEDRVGTDLSREGSGPFDLRRTGSPSSAVSLWGRWNPRRRFDHVP